MVGVLISGPVYSPLFPWPFRRLCALHKPRHRVPSWRASCEMTRIRWLQNQHVRECARSLKKKKRHWSYSSNLRNTGPKSCKDLLRSRLGSRASQADSSHLPPTYLLPLMLSFLSVSCTNSLLQFLKRATGAQLLLLLFKICVTNDACNAVSVVLKWGHWPGGC